MAFDCQERIRLFTPLPSTSTKLTLVHTLQPQIHDPMSAHDSVIALPNETSGSERVDSAAIPPSEPLVVKDASPIDDPPPAESATELPAEPAQTASDDTPTILLKDDTNIPDSTPTTLVDPVNRVEVAPSVSVELLNFYSLPPLRG